MSDVEGSWTIMVYMCGSDLESDDGSATDDITEMLAASGVGNVKVLIETGGCTKWNSKYSISSNKIQRWVIDYSAKNPKLTKVQELSNANMGESETLRSFIDYGTTYYPAENMGFIFWDHGGGSIEGACNDENYDDDCRATTSTRDAKTQTTTKSQPWPALTWRRSSRFERT